MSPIRISRLALGASFAVGVAVPAIAQQVTQQNAAVVTAQPTDSKAILAYEGYLKPPAVVEKIVSANRNAGISFGNASPDRKWFLKLDSEGLPNLTDFAKGHIYLGGLQVDTLAFRSRALTTRGSHGITLIEGATGKTRAIETVAGADISSPTWSPDGKTIAYIANFPKASHIYLLDVATGKSTQLTKTALNAVYQTGFDWSDDGSKITTVLIPQPFKPAPAEPAVAPTPIVRLTDGKIAKERIHPSLLGTPYEKDLLEYYATGQLAVIDLKTKTTKLVGKPAMIRSVNVSPDAQTFRVTLLEKPFSYIVPESNFGTVEQLWDGTGKVVMQMAKRELREGAPVDTTQADTSTAPAGGQDAALKDKTILGWNPIGPGFLIVLHDLHADSVAQAAARAAQTANTNARGGRGNAPAGRGGAAGGRGNAGGGQQASGPTKLAVWMPPYGANDVQVVYASSGRISTAVYTPDAKTLFLTAGNSTYAMRLADTTKHMVLQNATLAAGGGGRGGRGGAGGGAGGGRGGNNNAGTIATTRKGFVAIGSDNKTIFLSGTKTPGANWEKEGPQSWVDKMDIENTAARSRMFEGAPGAVEAIVAPLDDDYSKVIMTHESPTDVSNSFLLDTKANTRTKLTNNVDPTPEVSQAIRKRLWATRPDGVRFEVDVTLPIGYKEGTKLPGLIWFYPTEVATQQAYDQGRQGTNINRYPAVGPRSAEIWTTQGYVVIQPQAIPVFGGATINDHYVEELRDGLYATIEAVVNAGYLDRDRVGLWGHSYGAFSTVNAMVNTKWFKAGIAGDGMYNRTLTPYGFQNERRDFWQAQDTYIAMSPFFKADQLSGALLMYHQVEDQNEGTDPISSIRMFHALLGQGKTAALFMYPYEDHGPATKETDLDQWARFIAWMDLYLKNPKKTVVP